MKYNILGMNMVVKRFRLYASIVATFTNRSLHC